MSYESRRPYLWMLVGSFCFAWMGALAHALSSRCDWQVVALARSSLVLIFAALLARGGGVRLVLFAPRVLWLRSIAGSISLVCTFYAFNHLPPSHVLTVTNMFPVWVALLSWPLYRERPGRLAWLSVFTSVLGVALIAHARDPGEDPAALFQGNLAVLSALTASFATAVAMLGLHRLHYLHPWAIVVHFSAVAVLFCIAAFILGGTAPEPRPDTLLLLLAVGATATVGQLFLTKAFASGPPTKVSVVGLTQVVFAMILDFCLWDYKFDVLTLVGMGLVVAPTAWLMTAQARGDPRQS